MSRRRSSRKYSEIEFGYEDGRRNTVRLILPSAGITLEDEMLEKVGTAYFSLYGYTVTPGIRSLGLVKNTPWPGHTVVYDTFMSVGKMVRGPLHFSMSLTGSPRKNADPRIKRLRLWIQSTLYRHLYFNINFSRQDAKTFGDWLAKAGEWEIS